MVLGSKLTNTAKSKKPAKLEGGGIPRFENFLIIEIEDNLGETTSKFLAKVFFF